MDDDFRKLFMAVSKSAIYSALAFKQGQVGRPLTEEEIQQTTGSLMEEFVDIVRSKPDEISE